MFNAVLAGMRDLGGKEPRLGVDVQMIESVQVDREWFDAL
jgi:hypothetical protein